MGSPKNTFSGMSGDLACSFSGKEVKTVLAILDIESLQKVTKNHYRNSYGKSDDLKLFWKKSKKYLGQSEAAILDF